MRRKFNLISILHFLILLGILHSNSLRADEINPYQTPIPVVGKCKWVKVGQEFKSQCIASTPDDIGVPCDLPGEEPLFGDCVHMRCNLLSQCQIAQGGGSDECLVHANCTKFSHTECETGKDGKGYCNTIPKPGYDECTNHGDCNDNFCVNGGGKGACQQSSVIGTFEKCEPSDQGACLKKVCMNGTYQCIPTSIETKSCNLDDVGAPCEGHSKCELESYVDPEGNLKWEGKCKHYNSPGVSNCSPEDEDCPIRNACQNEECEVVAGEGEDECIENIDCVKDLKWICYPDSFGCMRVSQNDPRPEVSECKTKPDEACSESLKCEGDRCVRSGPKWAQNLCEIEGGACQHTSCENLNKFGDGWCRLVPGEGEGGCAPVGSECKSTHYVCNNQTQRCEEARGEGENECRLGSWDCVGRNVCRKIRGSGLCVFELGRGEQECSAVGQSCFRRKCVNNQCRPVAEVGPDECFEVPGECWTERPSNELKQVKPTPSSYEGLSASIDVEKTKKILSLKRTEYGSGSNAINIVCDSRCPFCSREVSKALKLAEDGKIRFSVVAAPFHKGSIEEFVAIRCAEKFGLGLATMKEYFKEGRRGEIDTNFISTLAGTNKGNFESCLKDTKVRDAVVKEGSDVQNAGINGTPTIFRGSQVVSSVEAMAQNTASNSGAKELETY